ncbi:MAG: hypothetical protein DRN37_08940 [Thermoplasmata archaeon]|nr:MAG: hypothetical protein B1H13_11540 [Desulfobacteraceae bacterium 4484_190.3]RLF55684.1 MAG: hypothetical protein DRN37_08940 [Thermoplasmata archaeon]
MAGKKIDEKTRREVRTSYKNGVPKKKIAERFSISVTSVTRIIKEQPPGEKGAAEPRKSRDEEIKMKIAAIERRIRDLEEKILQMEAKKKKKGFWF